MAINIQKQDAAYVIGKQVYSDLHGYTTRGEQRDVIDKTKEIDKDTVKTFITGFKSCSGTEKINMDTGSILTKARVCVPVPFFKQVMTEYEFPEKEQVAKDVATKIKDYLTVQGRTNEAEEIGKILNNKKIYKEDIGVLDDITNKMINYNY